MGKPLRLGIISKRCRLGQERRPSGNNIGEKGNSGFGWTESHIVHSPLIGRFETRNVSTDNSRHAFYPRRREREDANPPHEQAEEGQMLPRRGTRNEAPICCYCPSLTSRKASLIQMCMHLDTAVEKRNRPLTPLPHEGGRRMRVRGNATQRTPHPSFLDF